MSLQYPILLLISYLVRCSDYSDNMIRIWYDDMIRLCYFNFQFSPNCFPNTCQLRGQYKSWTSAAILRVSSAAQNWQKPWEFWKFSCRPNPKEIFRVTYSLTDMTRHTMWFLVDASSGMPFHRPLCFLRLGRSVAEMLQGMRKPKNGAGPKLPGLKSKSPTMCLDVSEVLWRWGDYCWSCPNKNRMWRGVMTFIPRFSLNSIAFWMGSSTAMISKAGFAAVVVGCSAEREGRREGERERERVMERQTWFRDIVMSSWILNSRGQGGEGRMAKKINALALIRH